jgi:hypothetical protein
VFTNYEGYDQWATASQAINRCSITTIQMGVGFKILELSDRKKL